MHSCPECGQACTCNGDVDDCLDICEDDADNCIHDCGFSDEDEDDGFGCCYPGECCMPGLHMLSECHTAEDIEQQNSDHIPDAGKMVTPNAGGTRSDD